MSKSVITEMGCEMMKLLRDQALSRQEMADLLGWSATSAEKWTRRYEAHGLLVATRAPGIPATSKGGPVPMLYTVAPAWRGPAA